MSKLIELYDKRGKAVTAARAFLDSKRVNGDTLSAEDEAAWWHFLPKSVLTAS